jgi:hypothetical protein
MNLILSQNTGTAMADLDQTYAGFFYRVNPNYELIIIGEFPQGRVMSITANDAHHLVSAHLRREDQAAPIRARESLYAWRGL